ncbi:hypothetical protein MUU53_08010 [Rhizobium lemnae]|uniref:Oxygenase n=1 Tax=Rhizobium lemnae TaxID=1214924 RepID=A0ABV8EEF1_9HYPH|nr:hypothetical protein [Rhizobium lemnae]MCJ8507857.1 hypothetical protein [Rhizobium lemnae]
MSFEEIYGSLALNQRIATLGPVCDIFTGAEGGSAIASVQKTPGGCGRHAVITINSAAAQKIAAIRSERRENGSYEQDPAAYEQDARLCFLDAVPEMISALMFAKTADATTIEVRGLPVPEGKVRTPDDGVVVERDVRGYVFNLVGSLVGSLSLKGFSYSSENHGRLLRAVAPVAQLASQASSQGYADDLGWHQDNANRPMVAAIDPAACSRGPMNEYQAFICVHADEQVPMDVANLEDIVHELSQRHGSVLVDTLFQPEFGLCRPSSHGGGLDATEVSLLARDGKGRLHGRFHAGNVIGMTPTAQASYDAFKAACGATKSRMEIDGERGAVLIYENTRVMHRRRRFTPQFNGSDRYYIRLYMTNHDTFKCWQQFAQERVFS